MPSTQFRRFPQKIPLRTTLSSDFWQKNTPSPEQSRRFPPKISLRTNFELRFFSGNHLLHLLRKHRGKLLNIWDFFGIRSVLFRLVFKAKIWSFKSNAVTFWEKTHSLRSCDFMKLLEYPEFWETLRRTESSHTSGKPSVLSSMVQFVHSSKIRSRDETYNQTERGI
jgi:hypothetical protein